MDCLSQEKVFPLDTHPSPLTIVRASDMDPLVSQKHTPKPSRSCFGQEDVFPDSREKASTFRIRA